MNQAIEIENFIARIRDSHSSMVDIFTKGSCLNFHFILKSVFGGEPYYNINHIITKIDGRFYDITGRVNSKGYSPYFEVYDKKGISRATKQMMGANHE